MELDKSLVSGSMAMLVLKVTAYEGEAAAGKPRRYYRLTKQGRGALQEKETAWNAYAQAVGRVLEGGACLA